MVAQPIENQDQPDDKISTLEEKLIRLSLYGDSKNEWRSTANAWLHEVMESQSKGTTRDASR